MFREFIGEIDDLSHVTADDLRRFIVWLRGKTVWGGIHPAHDRKLSPTGNIQY